MVHLAVLIGLVSGLALPPFADEAVSASPMGASFGDVIISEVAWGGTAADAADEWIELYNTTGASIDLDDWEIIVADGSPATITIPVGKSIPAGGYFLLERVESAVDDIAADHVYGGSNLSNTSEVLSLADDTGFVVDTANSGCSACWYDGSGSPDYYSMERVDSAADDAAAWVSNDGVNRNGLDADGDPINGTPHNSQIDLALSVKMSSVAGSAVPFTVTFTVTVSNMGYGTATNVTVRDDLPSGITLDSYVSSVGTYNDITSPDIWTVGDLPTGSSETLDITATVTAGGLITNLAEVWSWDVGQTDPDSLPGNALATPTEDDDDSIKIGLPVLDITNAVNNPIPNVGTNVVFTITVGNQNPAATGVEVDALLPSGLRFVSYSSTSGTYDGSSGIWTIGGLANGANEVLNVTATVMSNGIKTYIVDISSNEYGNNGASRNVNPGGGQADLNLTHDPVVVSASVADQVALTIRVSNTGPYAATGVEVRDLLPSGLSFVSYTSTVGTYNSGTGIWSVGNLAIATSAALTITVRVSSSGTSTTNFAEVWQSDQFDPNSTPGNGDTSELDDASVEVLVADLRLAETVDIAGSNAVFTITVSNAGPDDATGVNVETSLPALTSAYTFVSYGSTQGTYVSSTGIWDVGALANGESAVLTITTTTSGSLLVNWVEVSACDQVDPDSVPNNNSRTEDDDASAPSADLFLTQSVNEDNPDINNNVIFTITVTNAGVAGTTNVQVKDLLPSGLTYVSYTSTSGTYSSSTGIWTVGTLANGASRALSITAKVATSGIKTNWAEVWRSDESDPDSTPGNGSTTEDDDAGAAITSHRSIIINEVAWGGTAASPNDEWIELYNPGSASINITGWKLESASLDITLSGTISSGGYFLLEREDNFTVSDVTADQVYPGALLNILSDNGEVLTLQDGSGNFIDTANSENGGTWPKGGLAPNYGTMERKGTAVERDASWATNIGNPKNGRDANNGLIYGTPRKVNSTGIAPTSTPAIKTPTVPPPVGRPVINEFLARPGFDWNQDGNVDVFDEFIEVKNLGPVNISLNGWKLDDEANLGSSPYTLTDITLKPGERLVFYGLETNILLSDGGDTVRLLNPSGKVYDSYTYAIAKVEDESVCRLPDGNGNWYEDCTPTPNLTNTQGGDVPSMPQGDDFESPVCELPDTLPADFLFAECRGYGANVWRSMYWDETGWQGDRFAPENMSKWESFVE